jgi:hypothetical protein
MSLVYNFTVFFFVALFFSERYRDENYSSFTVISKVWKKSRKIALSGQPAGGFFLARAAGRLIRRPARQWSVRHRRSVDLLAPPAQGPVDWPNESRRSPRYWQFMTDEELQLTGLYLNQQVKAGRTVHQQDLDEARAEWRRRNPRC